jgi:hypothetical protein
MECLDVPPEVFEEIFKRTVFIGDLLSVDVLVMPFRAVVVVQNSRRLAAF